MRESWQRTDSASFSAFERAQLPATGPDARPRLASSAIHTGPRAESRTSPANKFMRSSTRRAGSSLSRSRRSPLKCTSASRAWVRLVRSALRCARAFACSTRVKLALTVIDRSRISPAGHCTHFRPTPRTACRRSRRDRRPRCLRRNTGCPSAGPAGWRGCRGRPAGLPSAAYVSVLPLRQVTFAWVGGLELCEAFHSTPSVSR